MAIQYQCTVTGFKMLTPTVFEILFQTDQPVDFKAGQFISIIIPGAGPNGRDLRRAYSIASAPEKRPIELCVKLVEGGPGTNYLYRLRPGDKFRGVAPYGDFVFEPKPGRHACLISTGTGIAPFRSMVHSEEFANALPASVMCLLGVRGDEELLYCKELEEKTWPNKKLKWVTTVSGKTSESYQGFKGRVTDYLRSLGKDYPWLETDYYLCGAGAMIDEVKKILAEQGVQKDSIHQEIYYKEPK
jgi:CDP-4-dehydro-6-deoxyglucose reductase